MYRGQVGQAVDDARADHAVNGEQQLDIVMRHDIGRIAAVRTGEAVIWIIFGVIRRKFWIDSRQHAAYGIETVPN